MPRILLQSHIRSHQPPKNENSHKKITTFTKSLISLPKEISCAIAKTPLILTHINEATLFTISSNNSNSGRRGSDLWRTNATFSQINKIATKTRRIVEISDKNVYPDLSNRYHAAVAATSTPIHIPLFLHSITSTTTPLPKTS